MRPSSGIVCALRDPLLRIPEVSRSETALAGWVETALAG
jgi:hypothetical protein